MRKARWATSKRCAPRSPIRESPAIGGRIVKTTGDRLLAEFASVVDALRCAAEVQSAMAESNAPLPSERRIEFRIGVHQGDIVVEDGDIFGAGVNPSTMSPNTCPPCLQPLHRPAGEGSARVGAAEPASPPLPDKPSIAVLSFANMSGDPEQEYFADGMVEEIITAPSRIRWLFVIARNSSFTYKGQAIDVKQVGRELGVRYVLEGSVRKAGSRVRITAQLIDATSGAHLWADRFDGSLEDVFDLQDQVSINVAGVIEPALRHAEIQRAGRKPTGNLDAYDLYLRALAESEKGEVGLREAIALLKAALAIDPAYATAAARIAYCRIFLRSHGFQVSEEEMAESGQLAAQAIRMGNDDPEALSMGAHFSRADGGERLRPRPGAQPQLGIGVGGARMGAGFAQPAKAGHRGVWACDAAEPARSADLLFRRRHCILLPVHGAVRGGHRMGRPVVKPRTELYLGSAPQARRLRSTWPRRGSEAMPAAGG